LSESTRSRSITGVHSEDLSRIGDALSGLNFPVERWELLDHATRPSQTLASAGPDSRTVDLLWTLPNQRYRNLDDVMTALARTRRGHPQRLPDQAALASVARLAGR
jgi:hypothetical protein